MPKVFSADAPELAQLPAPRLGVVGNPIAHSLSPPMQLAALRAAGMSGSYVRILCRGKGEVFRTLIEHLRALEFVGVNVTVPFKREARALADVADRLSVLCGASNTLLFRDNRIYAYNTDGPGFIRALRADCHVLPREVSLVLLGACGGAGRALAFQSVLSGVPHLVLANRPRTELDELAQKLRRIAPGTVVETCSILDETQVCRALRTADVVVNATSLGLSADDPPPVHLAFPRENGQSVFELITHDTRLLHDARTLGYRVCNGRDMLVHQGALSFEHWFGMPADVQAMRAAVSE